MDRISIRRTLLRAGFALATVFPFVSASHGQFESLDMRSGLPFDEAEAARASSLLNPEECPFPDSVAVPDTLDPARYYPLRVGNTWDYVRNLFIAPAPAIRRTVIADTMRGDLPFSKIKNVRYVAVVEGGVVPVDSSFTYESVIEGILTEWQPITDSVFSVLDFRSDFNTCDSLNSLLAVISGGYERSAVLFGPDTLKLLAEKVFEVGLRSASYGYTIGLLRDLPHPGASTTWLAGFTIDGESRGAPLDTIFAKGVAHSSIDLPGSPRAHLAIFPNPVSNTGWVEIEVERAGYVQIELIDTAGRRVSQTDDVVFLAPGRHTVSLSTRSIPSGLYLVKLLVNGQVSASNTMIVIR